jgi:hypothetical protein
MYKYTSELRADELGIDHLKKDIYYLPFTRADLIAARITCLKYRFYTPTGKLIFTWSQVNPNYIICCLFVLKYF